ncbi:MAG: hypothetical protein JWN46_2923 [Acidimicrobiales bacterium]|nr:hypothetical protein [Acidimicrobiales bacterium]
MRVLALCVVVAMCGCTSAKRSVTARRAASVPTSARRMTTATVPVSIPALSVVGTGQVRINFRSASVIVPSRWQVLRAGSGVCQVTNDVVMIDTAFEVSSCAVGHIGGANPASYVRIYALAASAGTGRGATINGHSAIVLGSRSYPAGRAYGFPDLGVVVEVAGPESSAILSTTSWSTRAVALRYAATSRAGSPPGWRVIRYEGVALAVPADWPIKVQSSNELPPGICGGPPVRQDTVLEGPYTGAFPSCPAPLGVPAGVDGVWLRPATDAGGQLLRNTPSRVYLKPDQSEAEVLLSAVAPDGHRVDVEVGLGPDPSVAGKIIASITS